MSIYKGNAPSIQRLILGGEGGEQMKEGETSALFGQERNENRMKRQRENTEGRQNSILPLLVAALYPL